MLVFSSNVFTVTENTRIDGVMLLFHGSDGKGYMEVEITSPYKDLSTSAEINKNIIEFQEKRIDENDAPPEVLLRYLYNLCKTFEENISTIKDRVSYYMQTEEYEKYSVYFDLKQELKERVDSMRSEYMNGNVSHFPHEFDELEEKLSIYEDLTENYRSPLFDEIPVICGMEISDDLIVILLDKFIHPVI